MSPPPLESVQHRHSAMGRLHFKCSQGTAVPETSVGGRFPGAQLADTQRRRHTETSHSCQAGAAGGQGLSLEAAL